MGNEVISISIYNILQSLGSEKGLIHTEKWRRPMEFDRPMVDSLIQLIQMELRVYKELL